MKSILIFMLMSCTLCQALEITYCIRGGDKRFRDDVAFAIYQWSDRVSGLTFKKVPLRKADTVILYKAIYFRGNDALGYCFMPQSSNVKRDAWQIEINPAYWQRRAHPLGVYNRAAIIMHEFGHRIGLDHNDRPYSIMFPTKTFSGPYLDDQDVIDALAIVN